MQYMGGKNRIRKTIAEYLESMRNNRVYLEPFCGGNWVLQEMSGERVASDSNVALITLYQELQKGWNPPLTVSEEEYQYYKDIQDVLDPMTAFCGIGCSFAGKWFGGYARSGSRDYIGNARNSLLKQLPLIMGVKFKAHDYHNGIPYNSLIYCDPPYEGTTGYKDTFDSVEFWEVMRGWSRNNTVIISEYKAPEDFKCVLEIPTKTDMRVSGKKEPRIEKLFQFIY